MVRKEGLVALEQNNVAEELVLPGERGAAGATPRVVPAVLAMGFEVSHDRELLVAFLASIDLRAVATLVMVPQRSYRFQELELAVVLVPPATLERTRIPPCPRGRRRRRSRGRPGHKRLARLVFVSVGSHMHSNIGVTLETLAADLTEMRVLCQNIALVYLYDFVKPVARGSFFFFSLRFDGRGGFLVCKPYNARSIRAWEFPKH